MDYYNAGDCDSTAKVYLYDGSPLIGRITGDDTVFNWALSSGSYLDQYSFRPQGGHLETKVCVGRRGVSVRYLFTQDSARIASDMGLLPTTNVTSYSNT